MYLATLTPGTAFARNAAAIDRCRAEVLQELGWRIEPATGDAIDAHGGNACARADLDSAHAAGDLVLRLPQHPAGSLRLTDVIDDQASRCAFAIRIGAANRAAIDSLVANPRFRFSGLQTGWIGFGAGSAAEAGWRPIFDWGRGFVPIRSNSEAMSAFHERPVRAECGVGRQVAQYAMLAELFGHAGFDRAFRREEIVIGTFNKLGRSESILLGSSRGEMFADGLARKTSALGRQAFNGAPGFLHHVFDASTLDDINNQAQNFVVYDVDALAADALRQHGGFAHYNRINRRIWELSQPFQVRGRRWFERLLVESDPRLSRRLTARERALHAELRGLLDDPFYRGFRVYGHPHGVKPIGYFVARMLDRNPRTPFRVELALHNLHTEVYERFVTDRVEQCVRSTGREPLVGSLSGGPGTVPTTARRRYDDVLTGAPLSCIDSSR